MYCIKCGNQSQASEMLCEKCKPESGFGTVKEEQLKKNKTYSMYLGLLGNLLLLIAFLTSFVLIKLDAPTDFAAEIFKEKTIGPVESEETEETDSGEEEAANEVAMEEKGYSYSVLEYLSRKIPDTENAEEQKILNKVMLLMQNANIKKLDLDDEEQLDTLFNAYGDSQREEVMEVLEKYDSSEASGVVVIVIGIVALLVAAFLLIKQDFHWSLLFSMIATTPIWSLFAKLDGITSWEYENGLYYFLAGMFAVVLGSLIGGNLDTCKECQAILPGGADFCFKCGQSMQQKKEKKNLAGAFLQKNSAMLLTAGNIVMFLPVVIPVFKIKSGEKIAYINLMSLRGLETVEKKGLSGILMLVLAAGLVLMIGAVVTGIFEKHIISIGCSIAACAMMVLAIYLAQKTVELAAMFTLLLIPAGLLLAVISGLNAPMDFGNRKLDKGKAE